VSDPVQAVVQASAALAVAGLGDLVWGHASVRDESGRGVWMKAADWGFDEVTADHVVLVDPSGQVVAGTGRRHLEFPIHTEIMACRPDVKSVVHTHAPAVNAFASLQRDLHPISHDAVPFTYPQLPRFTDTGALIDSTQLGRSLADALSGANAILMPNHGAVTVGADTATAVMYALLLERACRTELMALGAGGPRVWSDEAETRLKREQAWNHTQLDAGWRYLLRRAGKA
jgi:ribulose-5-phosphate 4-epimerase/fuculose-1-phosphate aldolase